MSCEHCVIAVGKDVTKLKLNIIEVNIGSAEIEYNFSDNDLLEAIDEAGFKLIERNKN